MKSFFILGGAYLSVAKTVEYKFDIGWVSVGCDVRRSEVGLVTLNSEPQMDTRDQ